MGLYACVPVYTLCVYVMVKMLIDHLIARDVGRDFVPELPVQVCNIALSGPQPNSRPHRRENCPRFLCCATEENRDACPSCLQSSCQPRCDNKYRFQEFEEGKYRLGSNGASQFKRVVDEDPQTEHAIKVEQELGAFCGQHGYKGLISHNASQD